MYRPPRTTDQLTQTLSTRTICSIDFKKNVAHIYSSLKVFSNTCWLIPILLSGCSHPLALAPGLLNLEVGFLDLDFDSFGLASVFVLVDETKGRREDVHPSLPLSFSSSPNESSCRPNLLRQTGRRYVAHSQEEELAVNTSEEGIAYVRKIISVCNASLSL